jgi:hypothetical protein
VWEDIPFIKKMDDLASKNLGVSNWNKELCPCTNHAEGSHYDNTKYTPEYRKIREAKQLPTKPDLFFSGKMLSNMTQKSTPTQAQVYFTAIREGLKAIGNQRKRKFFAIGDAEAPLLKNKFMEEYTKLMKI